MARHVDRAGSAKFTANDYTARLTRTQCELISDLRLCSKHTMHMMRLPMTPDYVSRPLLRAGFPGPRNDADSLVEVHHGVVAAFAGDDPAAGARHAVGLVGDGAIGVDHHGAGAPRLGGVCGTDYLGERARGL